MRILKCTEHWSWNVLTAFGTITTRFVRYAITRSPRREITSKRAFFGVMIVEQLHTKKRRRWKPIFIPSLKRRTKKRINFIIPFKSLCIWLFLSLVFNKDFKTVSRVWFYCDRLLVACFNWSFFRFLLFSVFIIVSQSSKKLVRCPATITLHSNFRETTNLKTTTNFKLFALHRAEIKAI